MRRLLATAVVLCAASAAPGDAAPPGGRPWRGAHPAVCRVIASERGSVSLGSGSLVGVDRTLGLVVTNWHVVRDATGPLAVAFPDGFRSTATLLAADRHWDLAALAIRRPNVPPIPLAGDIPRQGEWLTIAGYGSGSYKASTGRCTQYVSPGFGLPFEMVELSARARQGDSGGPILNDRGELAGVLFGTGFGRTSGSHCGRVRRFLGTVADDFRGLSSEATMIAARAAPTGPVASAPVEAHRLARQPAHAAPAASRRAARSAQARPGPVAGIISRPSGALPTSPAHLPTGGPKPDATPVPGPTAVPGRAGATAGESVRMVAEAHRDAWRAGPPGPLDPDRQRAPVAAVSAGRGAAPKAPPSGPTRAEQIKTILAGIGLLAVLLHGLRLLGAAAQS